MPERDGGVRRLAGILLRSFDLVIVHGGEDLRYSLTGQVRSALQKRSAAMEGTP